METRAHYVLIGSFALAIFSGAFLFVLWLGQLEIDQEFDYYDIVFNDPVTGLSVSGDVRFNGIKVGEVDALSLNQDNPNQVIARIKVDGGTPVKEDTEAQLELAGVTGVSFIQLSGGSPERRSLKEATGEDIPAITATPSEFQRLLSEGGDIIATVNTAVVRISEILSEENAENIRVTLQNVRAVTDVLAERDEEIAQLIDDLAKTGADLRALSDDLA
ncbi:MAG: MlaD family protein, partial [Pseudomonadota bacterium]